MIRLDGMPSEHARCALLDEVSRLESLAADLTRFAGGCPPSPAELASAPTLRFWRLVTHGGPHLVGICRGHPRLRLPLITTSTVWAMDEGAGWARTLSRVYALGEPAGHPGRWEAIHRG
ncbi:DUF6634 family protein [Muricoccus nepalensis]|uniref:DUF6634 family protein n=1 Tax=Muricoccus nepalensis TaxID=1854500 RepID=UPI0038CF59B0